MLYEVITDRAEKIAHLLNQDKYAIRWHQLKNEIKQNIYDNAWSDEKEAFAQSYHSDDLDASVLLMESYGFIAATDYKYKQTVLSIQNDLEHKGLMFRYKNQDDFGTPSSAFTICSFWLINALYKIGLHEQAALKFEALRITSYNVCYTKLLRIFST